LLHDLFYEKFSHERLVSNQPRRLQMNRKLILLFIAGALSASTSANERYYINFDLLQNGKVIERGNDYVTRKLGGWNSGHTSSYLKLRCDPGKSGKPEKNFSTTDHFSGVRLAHRLIENQIEVTVLQSQVKNRRVEIYGLAKSECKNLAPIVTTVTESYTFPARTGLSETRSFGDTMSFKYTIKSAGKNRVLID
jgi:hypothetical protein